MTLAVLLGVPVATTADCARCDGNVYMAHGPAGMRLFRIFVNLLTINILASKQRRALRGLQEG